MSTLAQDLERLDSAEAFFEYFGVGFDTHTLNVNRLHILKRFNQYLGRAGGIDAFAAQHARARCREMLAAAYSDFAHSSALEQKVFPVFQRTRGEHRVALPRPARTGKDAAQRAGAAKEPRR